MSDYIFSIPFDAQPNYGKIKFMFMQILLDREMVPTKEFDWNQKFFIQKSKFKEQMEDK